MRPDDLEATAHLGGKPGIHLFLAKELDRFMRAKVTSLDFRCKNDFPYRWNAVTSGVKASQCKQGTGSLTTVCINQGMKNPCPRVRASV